MSADLLKYTTASFHKWSPIYSKLMNASYNVTVSQNLEMKR